MSDVRGLLVSRWDIRGTESLKKGRVLIVIFVAETSYGESTTVVTLGRNLLHSTKTNGKDAFPKA